MSRLLGLVRQFTMRGIGDARSRHGAFPLPLFTGGEFLFCDVPGGPRARRREVPAGLGDALLFCTRNRLVRVGGAYGLQAVKHGLARLTAGPRTVLGVPFHDYR